MELETPLVRADVGSRLRVGIRAGDLLLATEKPRGLSARNILPGTIKSLEQRDVIVVGTVDCGGIEFEVHVTLAARDALQLARREECLARGQDAFLPLDGTSESSVCWRELRSKPVIASCSRSHRNHGNPLPVPFLVIRNRSAQLLGNVLGR